MYLFTWQKTLKFWSSGSNISIPVFLWGCNYTVKLLLLWSWSKLSAQACQIKIHARHAWLLLPVVLEDQVWTRISNNGKEFFFLFDSSPSNTPRMNEWMPKKCGRRQNCKCYIHSYTVSFLVILQAHSSVSMQVENTPSVHFQLSWPNSDGRCGGGRPGEAGDSHVCS